MMLLRTFITYVILVSTTMAASASWHEDKPNKNLGVPTKSAIIIDGSNDAGETKNHGRWLRGSNTEIFAKTDTEKQSWLDRRRLDMCVKKKKKWYGWMGFGHSLICEACNGNCSPSF